MTKKEPSNLMRKSASVLFADSTADQGDFLTALLDPQPRGNAVLWTVPRRAGELETVDRSTLPVWLPDEVELLQPRVKIGLSPAYLAGEIYSLDYSSVLAGSAMLAARTGLPESPQVLDLCAAPGGKSLLASVLLKPRLLLSNEVEAKRLGILRHNLSRCRVANAWTQRLAPEELASLAPLAFDLCLIDAPCSGQSLLAKGIENPGCFHPSTVKGNARRQLWILEAGARTVAAGGYVLYTTCTFAPRENEGVIGKFLAKATDFEVIEVPHLAEWSSPLADFPGYRFYPHQIAGAGGYAALLRRKGNRNDETATTGRADLPPPLLDYPVVPSPREVEAS
jgi:16S rRNA C967 or C1407 C5-methylase (RsmB/RsmF family)